MKIKCLSCEKISDSTAWNKKTIDYYGEDSTIIEEGINNINWLYICPECNLICGKRETCRG